MSGPCAGLTSAQIITKMIHDAAVHSFWNRAYVFGRDPFHPVSGKSYGYLLNAGGY